MDTSGKYTNRESNRPSQNREREERYGGRGEIWRERRLERKAENWKRFCSVIRRPVTVHKHLKRVPSIGVDWRNIAWTSSRIARTEFVVTGDVNERIEEEAKNREQENASSSHHQRVKRQRVIEIAIRSSREDGNGGIAPQHV